MTVSQLDHRPTRRRRVVTASKVLPVLALTALLAACSSGSPTQSGASASSGGSSSSGSGASGSLNIIVIGGKSDDPFWSSVKRGGEDAAKMVEKNGGSVTFLGPQDYSNLGPDAAKLEQTALSQKPAAVVGPDWVPEAQNTAWKAITSAGIPVVIYNAGGVSEAKNVGAIKYVGADDYEAGKAAGTAMASDGAKHVLCVNTLPGNVNSEARCKGIKDGATAGGGTSTELPLPSTNYGNPSAVTQAVKAQLLKDTSIDGVVAGAQDTDSSYAAAQQAGVSDKVRVGSFDITESQLQRIQSGKQLFAIDQQGYLQGYYGVSVAFQYVKFGLLPPQNPLLTGPLVVNKQNVKFAIDGTKDGVR